MTLVEKLEKVGARPKASGAKKDPSLERLNIYIGLAKFLFGTFALGLITLVLNQQYRTAQLELERAKSEHALGLQDKQVEVEYLHKFQTMAMDKDITVRVDFADYMKSVALSKTLQEIWEKYYAALSKRQAEHQEKIERLKNQKKDAATELNAVILKPSDSIVGPLLEKLQRIDAELYTTQEALDKSRYGTFKENYFDFQSIYDDAAAAERARDYERERDLLFGAMERIPKTVKPYFLARLAGAYRALHDFSSARAVMQQAVDLAPTAESLFRLAIMQKNDRQVQRALESLKRAAELSDDDPDTLRQIELVTAGYFIHNGQRDEGLRLFAALEPSLQPRDNFITNIAWFYAVAGRDDDFYAALERSLQINRQATLTWIDQEVDIDKYREDDRFKQVVLQARGRSGQRP
ncbi:hypothetical protein [Bradyrhizobium aeschynomenes]|uniref:hypothetical protein n=1 Tax=Bradyrhizobium aeschynomenes TaxID=2734909 RepID=UPI0015577619|nr:hypothetical protein [Bradyrhizobium aeschynomenes]NPV20427.1 hypothetical protein [Bradyrhizobium aeschynomenes]